MNIKTKVALRIKEIRKEKNLTQRIVALLAGLDKSFFSHIENGDKNVSIETLSKLICDGLDMTVSDFFNTDLFLTGKFFN